MYVELLIVGLTDKKKGSISVFQVINMMTIKVNKYLSNWDGIVVLIVSILIQELLRHNSGKMAIFMSKYAIVTLDMNVYKSYDFELCLSMINVSSTFPRVK